MLRTVHRTHPYDAHAACGLVKDERVPVFFLQSCCARRDRAAPATAWATLLQGLLSHQASSGSGITVAIPDT